MIDREMSQQQAEYEANQFTLCPLPLDFPSILCHTNSMTYTRSQLIDALDAEYQHLCHDDFDPDVDCSPAEYRAMLLTLDDSELLSETCTDDLYTLDAFMHTYG